MWSIAGTQAAETPDVKSTAPAPPAAPAAPEVKAEAAVAADAPAAPEAAPVASAAAGQPADPAAADVAEAKPAADAADAALDQKMAKEDKPRLVQVSTFGISMLIASPWTRVAVASAACAFLVSAKGKSNIAAATVLGDTANSA